MQPMFTGIVQGLGRIEVQRGSALTVALPSRLYGRLIAGGSIAVNGVCLTAATVEDSRFQADVSGETASRTTLGSLGIGTRVNLELPLGPDGLLDGHIVLGHVDAIGRIQALHPDREGWSLTVSYLPAFARYVTEKGSIAVDGISLTPFGVSAAAFRCAVIPATYEGTSLQDRHPGDAVNLEFDILGKYVERMMPHVR
jgi:riboflavin synthase